MLGKVLCKNMKSTGSSSGAVVSGVLVILTLCGAANAFQMVEVEEVIYVSNEQFLILKFSGAVDVDDVNCSHRFVLQNDVQSPTSVYTLMEPLDSCENIAPDRIRFNIGINDSNAILLTYDLFDSNETSVLQWSQDLIRSDSISTTGGALFATYIADTYSPSVIFLSFDLDVGQICLTFDSLIDLYTLSPAVLSFTNGQNVLSFDDLYSTYDFYFTFTSHACLLLSSEQVATLQSQQICLARSSCSIFFDDYFVYDPSGNSVVPISSSHHREVSQFISDITAPVMLGFELDLVTSVLAVVFDSGVDATSLDFTQITFTDGVDSESVTLTSGNAVTDIGIVIVVFITTNDQSLLSDHATICKSAASCYMSITSNFASDYSTNPVLAIPLDSSLPAQSLTVAADGDGRIYVTSVSFDHNGPTISLTFSEAVDVDSINCNQREFAYVNRPIYPTVVIYPEYPGECSQANTHTITFHIDLADYLTILDNNLFKTVDLSAVSWSDELGQSIDVVRGTQLIADITVDTSRPSIIAFDLNLNQALLTIFFDSIVNIDSLNVTGLVLQDSDGQSDIVTAVYNLTAGDTYTGIGATACVYLYYDDIYELTQLPVCNTRASCYISFHYNLVDDLFGNPVMSNTMQASRFKLPVTSDEGLLSVSVAYVGCYKYDYLLPNEPLILRTHLRETVDYISCNYGTLTWKMGSLENVTSPLTSTDSYQYFYHGLRPQNYGVFICTWENITTENFIVASEPFVGSPDGSVVYAPLYSQFEYTIQYGPDASLFDTVTIESTENIKPSSVADFVAVIAAEASDVLYSLSGDYVAQLSHSETEYAHSFPFTLYVIDPIIEQSDTAVVIESGQTELVLSCYTGRSEISVIWREGQMKLANSENGVALAPSNYHYVLTLDLSTYTLTGSDIVCEVEDPEGIRGVVASAEFKITLPEDSDLDVCGPEKDAVWSIVWDLTYEGATDQQPCPRRNPAHEVSGVAIRMCLQGGVWGKVDVSNCVSKIFADIENQVEEGLQGDADTRQDILSQLLPVLAEAVTPSNMSSNIFPQDLITVNSIVETVLASLIEDVVDGAATNLQTDMVDVLDKLLSEEHTENWRTVTSLNNQSDGSLLLENAEGYGAYMAQAILSDTIDTDDIIILTEDNIEVAAQKLDQDEYTDIVYPKGATEGNVSAQIIIPGDYLSSRKASAVVNMKLDTIADFLPQNDDNVVAAAPVISSQVIAEEDNSTVPIILIFTTYPTKNARNPRCVYWDYIQRKWREDGLKTLEYEELDLYSYRVKCESSHLTAFTAIVDISEEEVVYEWTVPAYVGAGSLAGCGVILILIIALALSCSKDITLLRTLLVAHIGFFVCVTCAGAVLLGGLTEATDNTDICTAVAALVQYFFTAASAWMLVTAFLVLINTQRKLWFLAVLIFGLGVPAIPTAISIVFLRDDYGTDSFCWISVEKDDFSSTILWANAAPMAALSLTAVFIALIALVVRVVKPGKLKPCGLLYIAFSSIALNLLVGGSWASGLVMVNGLWEEAEWLFMACGISLGVAGFVEALLFLCANSVKCNFLTRASDAPDGTAKYWTDKKGLLPEAKQLQSAYAMKDTRRESTALANVGMVSDKELVEMMEEAPQKVASAEDL